MLPAIKNLSLLAILAVNATFTIASPVKSRREWAHSVGKLATISASFLSNTHMASASAETKPFLSHEYFQTGATSPEAGRFFFPTLTPPFQNRATYRYTLGRNAWAFEQLLTFANVTATIRTTVVQLTTTGGLWVHSPQWPTGEFLRLLEELPGVVEHIVLPCNALEHKAPMKSFANKYPNAQIWVAPGQYGPFGVCGRNQQRYEDTSRTMGYRVDGILGDAVPPWSNEFDIATLFVNLPQNAGPVSEVAFCHRPTRTLIATDAVIFVPRQLPGILNTYFDSKTTRQRTFWARSVLQAVFLPLREVNGDYPAFEALEGRLVRAPILRAFADSRSPDATREWVKEIAGWSFDRILTSHFASPIAAAPSDFRAAYGYLFGEQRGLPPIACRDWELLEGLNEVIADFKLGAPAIYNYKEGCSG